MATHDDHDDTLDDRAYLFEGIPIKASDQLPRGRILMTPTDAQWADFVWDDSLHTPIAAPRDSQLPYVYDIGTHGSLGRSRCQSCGKQFCEPSDCRVHAVVARLANRTRPGFDVVSSWQGELIYDNPRSCAVITNITE